LIPRPAAFFGPTRGGAPVPFDTDFMLIRIAFLRLDLTSSEHCKNADDNVAGVSGIAE
jgi:hypothetical protein